MNNAQIESWVLSILDRLRAGQPIEDRRVELKREFIDPVKAARRLAGHANASHGDMILWIFGLDGKDAEPLIGVESSDFGQWWEQVSACFVELAPTVRDLNIPADGRTVVALVAETDRAPYVVLNPAYGQQGAGSVESEVPWRENTHVRSARRGDLIRILVPAVETPTVEIRSARLDYFDSEKPNAWEYAFRADLYLRVPAGVGPIIVPDHETSILGSLQRSGDLRLERGQLDDLQDRGFGGVSRVAGAPLAETAERGREQLIVHASGPIKAIARASAGTGPPSPDTDQLATVTIEFRPDGADRVVRVEVTLEPRGIVEEYGRPHIGWGFGEPLY